MREAAFSKQNRDKWKAFEEKMAHRNTTHPDELADLFVEVTDDLAYSQTYYPKSKTTQYLNGLAISVHQAIYRNKKERKERIKFFWTHEVPLGFYYGRKQLLVSLILFTLSIIAGIISTLKDEDFVRFLLGDYYVNMTLENIAKGDPMGVYARDNEVDMFLRITVNNIMVSMYAVMLGLLFGVGTYILLINNGIMIGVFFTFLYKEGVLGPAMLTVWIHGTIEIASIVMAGGAGILLGNSFVFPGTYTRLESLKRGARSAIKMATGLVPLFIIAGFIESFITRYYKNEWVGILVIGISVPFIIWYYIIYPKKLYNRYGEEGVHA